MHKHCKANFLLLCRMKRTQKSYIIFTHLVLGCFLLLLFQNCTQPSGQSKQTTKENIITIVSSNDLHELNIALEADIVHDFFPPPVASRIYLYPNIAAYEVMAQNLSPERGMAQHYSQFPKLATLKDSSLAKVAALLVAQRVGEELVYTNQHLKLWLSNFKKQSGLEELSRGQTKKLNDYVDSCFTLYKNWLKKDGYLQTRNAGDYQFLEGKGSWKPTPPDYLDAMEPHWSKIKPVFLDSASQFRAPPPTPYNMNPSSQFYKELIEVYDAVNKLSDSTDAIAKFWDCNPILVKHKGHISFAEKKLTPGGHWFNICRSVAIAENLNLFESSQAYAYLSIGLFDAFISCWDTKYHTNYIRPVTVIQNEINPDWNAILVTPNFPEYTSGHSVASRSAATILTHVFGENYAFTDSSEVPYGMPPRSFNSFYHASNEAAISRLYGGIHFRPSIENGVLQGQKVGQHIVSKLSIL